MSENCTWDYIAERAVTEAEYIVSTGSTVRACAERFCISKSTVHKDVSERLRDVNAVLYAEVRAVLDKNLSERHIRGGMATREKYLCGAKCPCGGCSRGSCGRRRHACRGRDKR